MAQTRQRRVPSEDDPTQGHPTRELLLDTAEQLFGELGIEAVSLRSVGQRAGQRNNSVAQYHFGSRQGLVQAIIEHRSPPVDARRRELIAQGPLEDASLADLVRLFVVPLAEAVGTTRAPTSYLRFLTQVVDQGDEATRRLLETDPTALRQVRAEMRRRLPDQPTPTFARRQRWLAQVTLRVLADQEREAAASGQRAGSGTDAGAAPTAEVVGDLVAMLVALLRAS